MCSPSDQNWSALMTEVMGTQGTRVKNFLNPKRGVFADIDESDKFYQRLACPLIFNEPAATVSELRQFFHQNFSESAARYAKSNSKQAADVARDLLSALGAFEPLVFPNDSTTPASLLDLGCGNGELTSALANHWAIDRSKVVGVDIYTPDRIPANITFRQMSPNSLPDDLLEDRFDLVVAALVLHHAEQPESLLSQMVEVLRPGGYLIIREHNADTPELSSFLDWMHVMYEQVFAPEFKPLANAHQYRPLAYWAGLTEKMGLTAHISYNPYPAAPLNTSQNGVVACQKPL